MIINTVINVITCVATCGGCIAALYAALIAKKELSQAQKEQKEGLERQKKEATLEAYNRLQEQVFDNINKYMPKDIKEICENTHSVEYKVLAGYLARIEHYCAGLECGIYDYETFYTLAHGYFDSEKGILMPRLLPIIECKSYDSKEDYFANLHAVWKKMGLMNEVNIRL